jgi:hypothetical protein
VRRITAPSAGRDLSESNVGAEKSIIDSVFAAAVDKLASIFGRTRQAPCGLNYGRCRGQDGSRRSCGNFIGKLGGSCGVSGTRFARILRLKVFIITASRSGEGLEWEDGPCQGRVIESFPKLILERRLEAMSATVETDSRLELPTIDGDPRAAERGTPNQRDPLDERRSELVNQLISDALDEPSAILSVLTVSAGDAAELAMILKQAVVEAAKSSPTLESFQDLLPHVLVILRLYRESARLLQVKLQLSEDDHSRRTRLPKLAR